MASSDSEVRINRVLAGLKAGEGAREPSPSPAFHSGRYELGGEVGRGAAAIVYEARDRELNRVVAIKMLREPLGGDPQSRDRFLREGQVLAALAHPDIVAVHDAGSSGDQLFLVLEFVDGAPLSVSAGPLEARLRLIERVARAVEFAHGRGIVHRDLKPGNILVTRDGAPKVGDFGLARIMGSEAALTRSGAVLGTPRYMAPEQVAPRGTDVVGPRTDVYALGVILFEMATGKPPFEADTVTELFGRILSEEPPPPTKLNPSVGRDLQNVILKAMEKDPAARYAGAGDLADDLARVLAGEPTLATSGGWRRKALRWAGRRRSAVGLAAALALAAVAGAAWWIGVAERSALDEANRLGDAAQRTLEKADACFRDPAATFADVTALAGEADATLKRARELAPRLARIAHLEGRSWELRGFDDRAEQSWMRALDLDSKCGPAQHALGRLGLRAALLDLFTHSNPVEQEMAARVAPNLREAQMRLRKAEALGIHSGLLGPVAASVSEFLAGKYAEAWSGLLTAVDRSRGDEVEDLQWMAAFIPIGHARPTETADAVIASLIRRRPHDPVLHLAKGEWCTRRRGAGVDAVEEDFREAEREFGAAIDFSPRLTAAYLARGNTREHLGNAVGAQEDYSAAIGLDPALWEARYNRAQLLWERNAPGDAALALEDYQKTLELVAPTKADVTWLKTRIEEARSRIR